MNCSKMPHKHVPMRRCVGCMKSKPKSQLVRVVLNEGQILLDEKGIYHGRGAYVCNTEECIEQAIKKNGFGRSYRQAVNRKQVESTLMELKTDE